MYSASTFENYSRGGFRSREFIARVREIGDALSSRNLLLHCARVRGGGGRVMDGVFHTRSRWATTRVIVRIMIKHNNNDGLTNRNGFYSRVEYSILCYTYHLLFLTNGRSTLTRIANPAGRRDDEAHITLVYSYTHVDRYSTAPRWTADEKKNKRIIGKNERCYIEDTKSFVRNYKTQWA